MRRMLSILTAAWLAVVPSADAQLLLTTGAGKGGHVGGGSSGPTISSISSGSPTSTTATITWTTNVAANSTVNYGPTTGYGSNQYSATSVISHSITLTGLAASTTYHFDIVSTDSGGTTTSGDNTFTTAAASSYVANPIHLAPNVYIGTLSALTSTNTCHATLSYWSRWTAYDGTNTGAGWSTIFNTNEFNSNYTFVGGTAESVLGLSVGADVNGWRTMFNSVPVATTATASWTVASGQTISVSSATNIQPGMFLYDTTLGPTTPYLIGQISSVSGTTLSISGTPAHASSGSSDNLFANFMGNAQTGAVEAMPNQVYGQWAHHLLSINTCATATYIAEYINGQPHYQIVSGTGQLTAGQFLINWANSSYTPGYIINWESQPGNGGTSSFDFADAQLFTGCDILHLSSGAPNTITPTINNADIQDFYSTPGSNGGVPVNPTVAVAAYGPGGACPNSGDGFAAGHGTPGAPLVEVHYSTAQAAAHGGNWNDTSLVASGTPALYAQASSSSVNGEAPSDLMYGPSAGAEPPHTSFKWSCGSQNTASNSSCGYEIQAGDLLFFAWASQDSSSTSGTETCSPTLSTVTNFTSAATGATGSTSPMVVLWHDKFNAYFEERYCVAWKVANSTDVTTIAGQSGATAAATGLIGAYSAGEGSGGARGQSAWMIDYGPANAPTYQATSAFTGGTTTTITLNAGAGSGWLAGPGAIATGRAIYDTSNGLLVGTVSSYNSGTRQITLSAAAANSSLGSTDNLQLSPLDVVTNPGGVMTEAANASGGFSTPSILPTASNDLLIYLALPVGVGYNGGATDTGPFACPSGFNHPVDFGLGGAGPSYPQPIVCDKQLSASGATGSVAVSAYGSNLNDGGSSALIAVYWQ